MNLKRKVTVSLFALLSMLLVPNLAYASEGVTELRSTTSESYRCQADSHQAQNRDYRVLVTCRDLVYPATSEVFAYVMWANPAVEGKIIKMGQLEFGKKLFTVGRPFTSVFVTAEEKPGVATPQGPVVMQGTVQTRAFLDIPTTATPTPSPEEAPEPTATEEEQAEEDSGGALSKGLQRASIIIAIILLAGAGTALFVILRSKKR